MFFKEALDDVKENMTTPGDLREGFIQASEHLDQRNPLDEDCCESRDGVRSRLRTVKPGLLLCVSQF